MAPFDPEVPLLHSTARASLPRRTRPLALLVTGLLVLLALALAPPSRAAHGVGRPFDRWAPSAGVVYDIAVGKHVVYLGGQFKQVSEPGGTHAREAVNIAAFDRATGQPLTTFHAATDGPVNSLALSADGRRLFLGGEFGQVDGVDRANLAVVDARSGDVVRQWRVDAGGPVRDLAVRGDRLFVGGQFIALGGERRLGLAAVDERTGAVRPFAVETGGGRPFALAFTPGSDILTIGGNFTSVDGRPRQYLARVNAQTGELLPWQPEKACKSCTVSALVTTATTVYVGQVGAGGGHVEALSAADGSHRFTVKGNGDIHSLGIDRRAGTVYVGGHFTPWFGGQHRTQVAAIDAATGAVLPFAPQFTKPHPGVFALVVSGRSLFVGGGFSVPGSHGSGRFAVFDR